MKHLKTICVCFVAVFAFSAFAVASASALPNFVPAKFPETFLGSTGVVKLGGASLLTCEKSMTTGKIEAAMLASALIDFNGKCEEVTNKLPCGGPTAGNFASKKILTEPLLALLGYTESGEVSKSLVGLLFEPKPPATKDAEFECVAGLIKVKEMVTGAIVSDIPNGSTNVKTKKIKLVLAVTGGKQAITSFQLLSGTAQFMTNIGLGASLNGGVLEPVTEEAASEIETQSEGEIKT